MYKNLTKRQTGKTRNETSFHPKINKSLNMQNKERMLKTSRGKEQVTYKGRPIRTSLNRD